MPCMLIDKFVSVLHNNQNAVCAQRNSVHLHGNAHLQFETPNQIRNKMKRKQCNYLQMKGKN